MNATWIHSDPRGPAAITDAIRRAKAGMWSAADDPWPLSGGDRIADMRMLIAASVWTIANLSGAVEITDASGRLNIDGNKRPTDYDKALAARAIERSWQILSGGRPLGGTWQTHGGGTPLRIGGETGAIPLGIVIAVGIIVAVAAVSAWAVQCAKETAIVTHQATIDSNQRIHLKTLAEGLEALNKHAAQERDAGRPLPLSDETKARLDLLLKAQETATNGNPPPLGDAFAKAFGGSAGAGIGGGLVIAAALVAAYLVTKE